MLERPDLMWHADAVGQCHRECEAFREPLPGTRICRILSKTDDHAEAHVGRECWLAVLAQALCRETKVAEDLRSSPLPSRVCPKCNIPLDIVDVEGGKVLKCKKCGSPFIEVGHSEPPICPNCCGALAEPTMMEPEIVGAEFRWRCPRCGETLTHPKKAPPTEDRRCGTCGMWTGPTMDPPVRRCTRDRIRRYSTEGKECHDWTPIVPAPNPEEEIVLDVTNPPICDACWLDHHVRSLMQLVRGPDPGTMPKCWRCPVCRHETKPWAPSTPDDVVERCVLVACNVLGGEFDRLTEKRREEWRTMVRRVLEEARR